MLEGKVAVIYGAGSIGSTVAKAFAAAGAQVYLAGRTQATLDAVRPTSAPPAGTRTPASWTPSTLRRCARMPTGSQPRPDASTSASISLAMATCTVRR